MRRMDPIWPKLNSFSLQMNGKKYEELDFELVVSQFKTSHERGGSSMAGNSTSTTALFSKKFNNLFVKNFPKASFTSEELKVSVIYSNSDRYFSGDIRAIRRDRELQGLRDCGGLC